MTSRKTHSEEICSFFVTSPEKKKRCWNRFFDSTIYLKNIFPSDLNDDSVRMNISRFVIIIAKMHCIASFIFAWSNTLGFVFSAQTSICFVSEQIALGNWLNEHFLTSDLPNERSIFLYVVVVTQETSRNPYRKKSARADDVENYLKINKTKDPVLSFVKLIKTKWILSLRLWWRVRVIGQSFLIDKWKTRQLTSLTSNTPVALAIFIHSFNSFV